VLTVQRRVTQRGEAIATVIFPDGTCRRMPTWMIEPPAAQLDIHEPPRFSREALNDLRRVLDVALSLLDDAVGVRTSRDGAAR
jgi:hypothetical protein